ncbi:unnamed protein product [Pleuronectes platessa]|uniref:Uncharacterized protein n=1 Tax=Pleuronectes platessa TaxID=8262 RepID=A0A9N7Y8X4_PLEPL|nr:unnamed protein product [Pleuronectes platessa]
MAASALYGKQRRAQAQQRRLRSPRQNSPKKHSKRSKITIKRRLSDYIRRLSVKIKRRSTEKQARQTIRRELVATFPRLSRHLELLPSSESFAFDGRYFHLPYTQVMIEFLPIVEAVSIPRRLPWPVSHFGAFFVVSLGVSAASWRCSVSVRSPRLAPLLCESRSPPLS